MNKMLDFFPDSVLFFHQHNEKATCTLAAGDGVLGFGRRSRPSRRNFQARNVPLQKASQTSQAQAPQT
jgi:hypothetical protein